MGWFRFSYRFILLPSFAGLACYACKPTANTAPSALPAATIESVTATATETTVGPDPSVETATSREISAPATADTQPAFNVSASSAAYQEGINLASSAHILSQSALSPDDWGLIASRWERAVTQLRKVDSQDAQYEQAQQKAVEYARNAEAANAQIAQLQAPRYVPLAAEINRSSDRRITSQNTPAQSTPTQGAPAQSTPKQATATAPTTSSEITQIPIARRLHGTPVVQVTFNRSRTYEMILDTGASRTLITRQMAQDLGIVTTERMIAATASQAEVSFDIGQVDTISMGNIVMPNARVSIGDAINIGLLGNDFLQGYDVTIRANTGFVELSKAY